MMYSVGLYSTEKAGEVKGRMLRRTMIRYIILAYCIALRAVSFRLKKSTYRDIEI